METQEKPLMELLTSIQLHYGNLFHSLALLRDWIGCVYEVSNDGQKYIVKVFRTEHTKQALQSIEVMSYLKQKEFPVPYIMTTLTGDRYITYNNQIVILYEFISGESIEPGDRLSNIGELTGWMRTLMEAYPLNITPHGYNYFIKRYLDIMKMKGYHGIDQFTRLGDVLWDKVNHLSQGFIHGDLHAGNMFLRKDKLVLFDFDAAAYSSPVYDIATACDATDYFDLSEDNFTNGYRNTQKNVAEFLKRYEVYHKLSREEEQAIYYFIAIRHYDIQATIMQCLGLDCVDDEFLENQYSWLEKWMKVIAERD